MKSLHRKFGLVVAVSLAVISVAQAATAPTFENVSYGPHERNVLDLWRATSDHPTPLVVFIHGGGFRQGDKGSIRKNSAVQTCLDAGVSLAAINYRFRDQAPIQDILRDAARAIQYIRSRAAEWNIDPVRIAAYGGSAGAGASLWLAFHDDLADPNSTDPVLRQSSRLAAAGSLNGQVSYDLRDWETFIGPNQYDPPVADRLTFYGFTSTDGLDSAAADRTMKDCSMIGLITQDDPPVVVACSLAGGEFRDRGHYVHHPKHAIAIADRCKVRGVECPLILNEEATADRAEQSAEVVAFLIDKLKAAPGAR